MICFSKKKNHRNFSHVSLINFSILVDAAGVDNSTRISPENNLDFYGYQQATPYNVRKYKKS